MKTATVKGKSIEPGIKIVKAKHYVDSQFQFQSQKRSKSYSRIMKGAAIKKSAAVPSIPSKYQRVLVNSKPQKNRFSKKHELKCLFNTEPGPGTYKHRDIKSQQGSRRKNDGPGFDTGEARFNDDDQYLQPDPGPGTYNAEKPKRHTM